MRQSSSDLSGSPHISLRAATILPMSRWGRIAYLVVMTAVAALYFALPDPPRYLWTVIGCLSVAAIVTGILVNRPRQRLPWWLVAAGTATFIAGDTTYDLLSGPLGLENPFPSVADVLYLCTYPLFARRPAARGPGAVP